MTCDQMIRQDPIRAVMNGHRQWVAHSVAGRMRLRLPAALAGHGLGLAQHLALHPEVQSVRWTSAARSLTVSFDRSVAFDRILDDLSRGGMHNAKVSTPAVIVTRPAVPALATIVSAIGGPVGLVAGLLLGSMETHHVTRLPQPLRLESEPARAHRPLLPRTSWHRHGRHAAQAARRRRCPASTASGHEPHSAPALMRRNRRAH